MIKFVSNLTNFPVVQKFFLWLQRNPHILYYHIVADRKPTYYYQTPLPTDAFKFQIDWLKKNNFEFVPLGEISKNKKNRKQVAITTDDGFVENYTTLAPLLKDYNIPATLFLLNNCIDNRDMMWMNKLFAAEQVIGKNETHKQVYNLLQSKNLLKNEKQNINLIYRFIPMREKDTIANEIWRINQPITLRDFLDNQKPYLTSNQINELLDAGFTIGAHTFSHPKCSQLSFAELEQEIVGSVNQLRKQFNTPVDYFAYPFGDRPTLEMENEVFRLSKTKAFLGTKNSDKSLKGNIVWERDKMEQPKSLSLFWFSVVPLIRKYILNPMGVYK